MVLGHRRRRRDVEGVAAVELRLRHAEPLRAARIQPHLTEVQRSLVFLFDSGSMEAKSAAGEILLVFLLLLSEAEGKRGELFGLPEIQL